jgi:hypothetical protein
LRSSSCAHCLPGTYQDKESYHECHLCAKGKFQSAIEGTGCDDCQEGWQQDQEGATECVECVAGKYQEATASFVCKSCPPGKHQPRASQSACDSCKAGQFEAGPGSATTCNACARGRFGLEGASFCTDCPAGKWTNTTSEDACSACTSGEYIETPVANATHEVCVTATIASSASGLTDDGGWTSSMPAAGWDVHTSDQDLRWDGKDGETYKCSVWCKRTTSTSLLTLPATVGEAKYFGVLANNANAVVEASDTSVEFKYGTAVMAEDVHAFTTGPVTGTRMSTRNSTASPCSNPM